MVEHDANRVAVGFLRGREYFSRFAIGRFRWQGLAQLCAHRSEVALQTLSLSRMRARQHRWAKVAKWHQAFDDAADVLGFLCGFPT